MNSIPSDNKIVIAPSKRCSTCKIFKPLSDYHRNKARPDGFHNRCKECWKNHPRSYNILDARRAWFWNKRYGMTRSDYEKMSEQQGHVCAICKMPETSKARSGEVRILAVDHCHETGKIRGLLCTRCNRLLGEFNDDAEIFQTAATYLISSQI